MISYDNHGFDNGDDRQRNKCDNDIVHLPSDQMSALVSYGSSLSVSHKITSGAILQRQHSYNHTATLIATATATVTVFY